MLSKTQINLPPQNEPRSKKSYNQYIDSLNAYFSFIGIIRLCLSLQQKKKGERKIETVHKYDGTLA